VNCEESPVDGWELYGGADEFEARSEFAARTYTSLMKFIDFRAREGILHTFAPGTTASGVANVLKCPWTISFRIYLQKESFEQYLVLA
jgi:hypothetical protein